MGLCAGWTIRCTWAHGIVLRMDRKTYMGGHTCISKRNRKTSHGTAVYRYSNCLFLLFVHFVSLLADEITARIEITDYSVKV